ncbi:MAG: GNAT family N-acetyltransferase [Myxococcales bacterium]|nr:GNAT family N-acetyltransferase [Myxococcales bacterium]
MSDAWLSRLSDPDPWQPPRPLPAALRTPRTIVRSFEKGDGPRLFEAVTTERPKILPWMLWALTDHQRVDDSIYYVERCVRGLALPSCNDFPLAIADPETGQILGGVGFHRIDRGSRCGEIGYWIRGEAQGRGLATEVAGALTSQGLTPTASGGWGFRRIVLFCDAANDASRRVADKLGFRLELRSRKERYSDYGDGRDPYVDMLGFAVLHDDWDFQQHRAKPGIGWS